MLWVLWVLCGCCVGLGATALWLAGHVVMMSAACLSHMLTTNTLAAPLSCIPCQWSMVYVPSCESTAGLQPSMRTLVSCL